MITITKCCSLLTAQVCLCAVSLSVCQAQQTTGSPTNVTSAQKVIKRRPPAKPFKRDEKEFQVNDLKSVPDLPNLPTFPTGRAEFVSATTAPNALSGQIYTVTYQTKDTGPVILEWYSTAFKSYGWTARKIGSIISAEKEGARCQIFLMRAIRPEFNTNFVVNYTMAPPPKQ